MILQLSQAGTTMVDDLSQYLINFEFRDMSRESIDDRGLSLDNLTFSICTVHFHRYLKRIELQRRPALTRQKVKEESLIFWK